MYKCIFAYIHICIFAYIQLHMHVYIYIWTMDNDFASCGLAARHPPMQVWRALRDAWTWRLE